MQIRKQLRLNVLAFTTPESGEQPCGCQFSRQTEGEHGPQRPCRSGYHGKHTRVRFAARSQSHGNATGQSKGKISG